MTVRGSRQASGTAIAGIYATRQARHLPGAKAMSLTLESVKGALADAGLSPRDVDGMAVFWPGPGGGISNSGGSNWAHLFGLPLSWAVEATYECAGVRGLLLADAAITAGLCTTVVIGGAFVTSELQRNGHAVGSDTSGAASSVWGAYPAPLFALVAQRHMHEYGTTPEQLAKVASTIRNHGHDNPEAALHGRGPFRPEDILASPMVSTPLHLLDCAMVAEGGCAIVVTTAERAKDLPQPPVMVLGGAMEYAQSFDSPPLYRDVGMLGASSARRALERANVDLDDIDVLSLYDPTSFEVLRQFEALGFCPQGEGGPFVAATDLTYRGERPTNPDGGLLSHSWIGTNTLTLKVIEAVRQLRGQAVHQVVDAEVALVTNAGSAAGHFELAVLGRTGRKGKNQ